MVTPVGERVYRGAITPAKHAARTSGILAGIPLDAERTSLSAIGEQDIVETRGGKSP